jgi:hypothetical protein
MKRYNKISLAVMITVLSCVMCTSLKAQLPDSTVYPVVIQFNSIGTGVPGDSALRNFIISFKKKNKIKKITASHIGPMGREGEYWLCFTLKELSHKQATAFIKGIKSVAEKPTARGSTVFVKNMTISKDEIAGRTTISQVVL